NDLAILGADLDETRASQKLLAAQGGQLIPELVRPPEERNVVRVLEVGEADGARLAVRASAVVAGREAVDAKDSQALAREVEERRASYASSRPHDDRVVRRCRHRALHLDRLEEILDRLRATDLSELAGGRDQVLRAPQSVVVVVTHRIGMRAGTVNDDEVADLDVR